jgi:hypothetical protein
MLYIIFAGAKFDFGTRSQTTPDSLSTYRSGRAPAGDLPRQREGLSFG